MLDVFVGLKKSEVRVRSTLDEWADFIRAVSNEMDGIDLAVFEPLCTPAMARLVNLRFRTDKRPFSHYDLSRPRKFLDERCFL